MIHPAAYLAIGVGAGVMGGLFGIGGATIVVPCLIFLAGYSQHQAQGTMLAAMVPPVALLAAWKYYHAGYVNLSAAVLLAIGFFCGGYFGAQFAALLSGALLRRLFGLLLLALALRMICTR